jgi:acyl-CoA synthetase (AMP-forming)/AMP-acid ligase II
MVSAQNNLYSYLLRNAQADAVALISDEGTITYGELIAQAESVAFSLTAAGVQKGERVGILAENSVFWVASYLAILKIGAVAVPLPQRLSEDVINASLAMVGCQVICLHAKRLGKYAAALPPGVKVITNQPPKVALDREVVVLAAGTSVATCPVADREDLAALMFTSGSTGQPNAVKVSHRNIIANTESIIQYLELTAGDRLMVLLPFEYCFGTSLLHTHLRVGASLVLHNSFLFLEDLLNKLESLACTGFAGVPMTFQHLLRRSNFPKRQFPHLRYVQQAGGRLPDVFIKEFLTAQPDVRFFTMYGATEATARLSYLPPDRLTDKLGSIGRGIPGVSLKVFDADGNPVATGEIGEIVAEGDNITLGYWLPDPLKDSFRNGRLYTGDMARVDEEGFIFIADRVSDFIKPNGHRISSREIEEVLAQIPDLLEVAVVGMPDVELGEAARAFIVTRKGSTLSESDILNHCKKHLAAYAVPRQLVFMAELPKNDAQKVLKKALKQIDLPPASSNGQS